MCGMNGYGHWIRKKKRKKTSVVSKQSSTVEINISLFSHFFMLQSKMAVGLARSPSLFPFPSLAFLSLSHSLSLLLLHEHPCFLKPGSLPLPCLPLTLSLPFFCCRLLHSLPLLSSVHYYSSDPFPPPASLSFSLAISFPVVQIYWSSCGSSSFFAFFLVLPFLISLCLCLASFRSMSHSSNLS